MSVHFMFYRLALPLAMLTVLVTATPRACLADQVVHAVELDSPTTKDPGMETTPIPSIIQQLFMLLPRALTPRQQSEAMTILTEAAPRIAAAQGRLAGILEKLRDLSFSPQSQSDTLSELGQELVVARDALRGELRRVSENLERGIGLNPRWDVPRSCAMPQTVHKSDVHNN